MPRRPNHQPDTSHGPSQQGRRSTVVHDGSERLTRSALSLRREQARRRAVLQQRRSEQYSTTHSYRGNVTHLSGIEVPTSFERSTRHVRGHLPRDRIHVVNNWDRAFSVPEALHADSSRRTRRQTTLDEYGISRRRQRQLEHDSQVQLSGRPAGYLLPQSSLQDTATMSVLEQLVRTIAPPNDTQANLYDPYLAYLEDELRHQESLLRAQQQPERDAAHETTMRRIVSSLLKEDESSAAASTLTDINPAQLQILTVKAAVHQREEGCPICFNPWSRQEDDGPETYPTVCGNGASAETMCSNFVCEDCLDTCARYQGGCPLCRREVYPQDIRRRKLERRTAGRTEQTNE